MLFVLKHEVAFCVSTGHFDEWHAIANGKKMFHIKEQLTFQETWSVSYFTTVMVLQELK